MIDLEEFRKGYLCLSYLEEILFCLNKKAKEENGPAFQTKKLIEKYDSSAYCCCAMDPDEKNYDLEKIFKCPHRVKQKLVFNGEKIEGNETEKEEFERIERERQRFYETFNKLKKNICSSLKPHYPFSYCLNDEAKDKKDGAIKKLEKVYLCCAMNPDEKNYDLEKIFKCPYNNLKS